MRKQIFNLPSEPIEIVPRSKEEYKVELAKLAEEEQAARISLREVLGEISVKKSTKSQIETNILQLQEKEQRYLKQAADAKDVCDQKEAEKATLEADITKLRSERTALSEAVGTTLAEAETKLKRANSTLERNNLLQKGLLFVGAYILEVLSLAKARLVDAEAAYQEMAAGSNQLDALIRKAQDLYNEQADLLKQTKADREQAAKDRLKATDLLEKNTAVAEELKLEQASLARERRRLKLDG